MGSQYAICIRRAVFQTTPTPPSHFWILGRWNSCCLYVCLSLSLFWGWGIFFLFLHLSLKNFFDTITNLLKIWKWSTKNFVFLNHLTWCPLLSNTSVCTSYKQGLCLIQPDTITKIRKLTLMYNYCPILRIPSCFINCTLLSFIAKSSYSESHVAFSHHVSSLLLGQFLILKSTASSVML